MPDTATFDDLADLYQSIVLERGRHPRHMRCLDPFDASAQGDNPLCGDRVEVRLRVGVDGAIAEAGFEARGCAISIAAADLMAEHVAGLDADRARALAQNFAELVRTGQGDDPALEPLRALAGVYEYPARMKCATLPWRALVAALDEWETGHG